MSERSTLEFRSNIYPLVTNGQIANDRTFLDSISEPFALDVLWHYNATRGGKLNRLQRRQHGKGQHCMYADPGDYPWGTRIVDGTPRVVCLCENWTCPLMRECRPGIEIPEVIAPEPKPEPEHLVDADVTLDDLKDSPGDEGIIAPEEELTEVELITERTEGVPGAKASSESEGMQSTDQLLPEKACTGDETELGQALEEERPAPRPYPKHYDDRQSVIVEAEPTRRLYVTAGPGTGKTHTLIEKLKYMIDVQEVDPGSIMVMSFTRAAVQVVKDRLQQAALDNELEGNWQGIDVTTFDKFCTRLLYWLKANEPRCLGRREIGSMDYDHRINAAAMIFRGHPELVSQCQHLIVDETQDLVGSRARLVLALIRSLPKDCGITLLGDRCQSVYDYQANAASNSEAFYDSVQEIGGFTAVTLEKNYRQNVRLPYSLSKMRKYILDRDVPSAGAQVAEVLSSLGQPDRELRSLGLSSLQKRLDGTLGILTRTNAQAISISSLFYKHNVAHTLLRAEKEAFWSRIVADVLIDYAHATIDESYFIRVAEGKGLSFENAIRAWIGLTSLRGANAEGARYKVEDLLHAMTEEVVPESLVATKGIEPGITISTIHGSKGREFDRVWIMSGDLESASASKVLDEQKVAYVALSRARLETALQMSNDAGLKIDRNGERCYRVSGSSRAPLRRRARKRLTHIELRNSTDIDQTSLLFEPELRQLAVSGALEGMEIRLCLPEIVPESGPVAYEIVTEEGILLGKTTLSFISYYERYHDRAVGGLPSYLPEAFDEVYVDRIISCVGKSARAPKTARRFGDYAIWYGFTLGGFAHADNSQSH